jgi:hypothetical protein
MCTVGNVSIHPSTLFVSLVAADSAAHLFLVLSIFSMADIGDVCQDGQL